MTIPSRTFVPLLLVAAGLSGARTIHFDANYLALDADGSAERPWSTLDHCFTGAVAGDLCLLEPGEYNLATPTGGSIGRVTRSGTASAPIRIEARLPGSVAIGAWHKLDWTPAGPQNIWTGSVHTPLAAPVATLQSVWAGRLNQDGVRLWYLGRRTALQPATWPRSPDLFPRTAILQLGSNTNSYNLLGMPAGDLAGAKAHVFRDEEQGALVRGVVSKSSATTLTIDSYGNNDALETYGGSHRVWLSNHPSLLDGADIGKWTTVPGTANVRVANSFDPSQTSFVLQISAVGPDLSGISYWQFRNLSFMGVVPVTNSSSTGLVFEGNSFDRPGLSDGSVAFDASFAIRSGFVVEGSSHVIDRNSFSGCALTCIEVLGSSVEVRNNTITYSQLQGGAYSGAVHVLGANAKIAHNILAEMGGSGIVLNRDAGFARVSRNRIENWGRLTASRAGGIAALFKTNSAVEIDSNLVINEARLDPEHYLPRPNGALNLLYGRNRVFAHHNIVENAKVGIRLGGWDDPAHAADNNSLSNSLFSNSLGSGLQYSWLNTVPGSSNAFVGTRFANTIFRTVMGVQAGATGDDIVVMSPTSYLPGGTMDHNLLPASDPLFIAPVADDWNFGLLAGSAAIDGGAVYTLPNGQAIGYTGALPDIGAVEFGTTWQAGIEVYQPPVQTTAFSMDDPSVWNIPADQPVVATTDKTEGAAAFEVTPTGYKVLESPAVNQGAIGGLSFVSVDALISQVQSNPWWVGAVQVYVECPSRGLWNQWVGQWELTGRLQGDWQTLRIPLPTNISQQLNGASYNDLKVRIAVNLNPGSGPLKLDNFRFEP